MLNLDFSGENRKTLRLLCIGAHSDDIEIGCSGTVLQLIAKHPKCEVLWIVLSSDAKRKAEAERSARRLLKGAAASRIDVQSFRDGFFPFLGAEIKSYFETLKRSYVPDLILTHTRDDAHQDHRVVCDLTWNTFRNHFILEYEIPKYDGDFGRPSFFVPLSAATCRRKIRCLMECFASQRNKHWFTEELFMGLMRIRGMEANSSTGFAEAFHCRKACLGL